MPELPEVQTILNDLVQAKIIGLTIKKIKISWPRTIGFPDSASFTQLILNKKIIGLSRRGKYLIFHLSDHADLVIHLRMTGRLLFGKSLPESPYIRVALELDQEQHLLYHDTRKFGRFYLVTNAQEWLKKLGPEPLGDDFTFELFQSLLKDKKGKIKPLLLDQTFLAGMGNIYVDEALWMAHLHPTRKANSLDQKEIKALFISIIQALKHGISNQGTSLGTGRANYYRLSGKSGENQIQLNVFRRTGKPCPRCGKLIERIVVAQRSSHFCPLCQKE